MFGLINHNKLCKSDYNDFRKNYCGTCKTIGKLYGQKERLLLNNDVVFLSELLAEISNREDDFKYIRVNSCFNLPEHKDSIPSFLQYTASINILLGYYKVIDNIKDSNYVLNIWSPVRALQTKNFKEAKRNLERLQLPVGSIEALIQEQFKRESGKKRFEDIRETFKYYSALTGRVTGEVFKHGAFILNQPGIATILYEIGYHYGEIIYLVDAVDDYKKDLKNKSFNPVTLHHSEQTSPELLNTNQQAYDYICSAISKIQDLLSLLPVPQHKTSMFITRISESVNNKLRRSLSFEKTTPCIHKRMSIGEKYHHALQRTKMFLPQRRQGWTRVTKYALFAGVLILVFLIFPNITHASLPDNNDKDPGCKGCFENCCNDCCNSCCNSCCESLCNKQ